MEMDIDTILKDQNTSSFRIIKGENISSAYIMFYQMIATNSEIMLIADEFRFCMKFLSVLSRCKKLDVRELACTILEKLSMTFFKKIHHNMESSEKEGTPIVLYTLNLIHEFSFKEYISTRIHDIDQKLRGKVMQLIVLVSETGYLKSCLLAFHILKTESSETSSSNQSGT